MKKDSISTKQTPVQTVHLNARFTPDGPEKQDRASFLEFWVSAKEWSLRLQRRDLARRKKAYHRVEEALQKVTPILSEAIAGTREMSGAAAEVQNLVPDEALRTQVFNNLKIAIMADPLDQQLAKERLMVEQEEIVRREKLLRLRSAVEEGLSGLWEAAEAGDVEAAEDLADVTAWAAGLITRATRFQPGIYSPIARKKGHWAVLATIETGWEKQGQQLIADLGLGTELQNFHCQFRSMRGCDANFPARRWAKAAVRVIEETVWRHLVFGTISQECGSKGDLADFAMKEGWDIGIPSGWVEEAMKLKRFSKGSVLDWKPVVRRIVRDDVPDFHLYPDWVNQRNTAAANGRNTPGEIQCAILDDIGSALAGLAP